MMKTSNRVNDISGQPMFRILQKAKEIENIGKKLYHFELGDTDFQTPKYIRDTAISSINSDRTHYSPSQGESNLLHAAQIATERSRGFTPLRSQLLVTPGANMQIYLALACVCDPGDCVIIPSPYFPSYCSQAISLGLFPSIVTPGNDYTVDVDELKYYGNYKAIILNYPNNPSGAVYDIDKLARIYSFAEKHGMYIIADEVYSRMIYDGKFCSISVFDRCKERVILVNGFSKSFGMTGWRIGVCTAPVAVTEKMTVLLETILSCVPQFIQDAASEALLGDQEEILKNVAEYKNRRDVMCAELNKIPSLELVSKPKGGMYCWAKIKNGMKSQEYADYAMEKGVVLAPGWIFGMDNHVRFAFTTGIDNIIKGIELLK